MAELLGKTGMEAVEVLLSDTEGYDFQVLKTFFDHNCRLEIIRYEHSHLRGSKQEAWEYLIHQGYVAYLDPGNDETLDITAGDN